MNEVTGDIWDYAGKGWIVVPITLELEIQRRKQRTGTHDYKSRMLNGIAQQAKTQYAKLDEIVGRLIEVSGNTMQLYCLFQTGKPLTGGLIFFPTQEKWLAKAKINLIETGIINLPRLPIVGDIYVPLLGCGYGRLEEKRVLPIMQRNLTDDRFTLVRRGPDVVDRYPNSFRTTRHKDNHHSPYDRTLELEQERAHAVTRDTGTPTGDSEARESYPGLEWQDIVSQPSSPRREEAGTNEGVSPSRSE